MISIIQFINEKLTINSKSNITDGDDEVLDDILAHFEFNDLYERHIGINDNSPFLNKDEGEEIKNILKDFIKENNISKDSLKYYIQQGYKFKDKKIAKDFRKHNPTCSSIDMTLNFSDDKKQLYKKNSLYFEVSVKNGIIGMFGPYGGAKYCTFK